jgi:hypothetical protein
VGKRSPGRVSGCLWLPALPFCCMGSVGWLGETFK